MRRYTFILFLLFTFTSIRANEPNRSFTASEMSYVRVATPGLFDGRKSFTVHLENLKEGEYCFPLKGAKVISAYGTRGGHSGADIKTKANDTIRCVFDGVVRMSKKFGGYGNIIVVRHPNGLESVYSHNSTNFVKPGDAVKAGEAIALTGRTGRATTEHLHFEFRVNGAHFNPNIIFDLKHGTLRNYPVVCTKSGNGVIVKPKITDKK